MSLNFVNGAEPGGGSGDDSPCGARWDALPTLVLSHVWSELSAAARHALRSARRTLRQRVDQELLQSLATCGTDALPREALAVLAAEAGAGGEAFRGAGPVPRGGTSSSGSSTGEGRFRSLSSLVLTPNAARSAGVHSPPSAAAAGAAAHTAAPSAWGLACTPLMPPPPPIPFSVLVAPFAASQLVHLVILDVPYLTERDVQLMACTFPSLRSLQLLISPAADGRAASVPPLGALRACNHLRALSVDYGRGGCMRAAMRASLAQLTQLTRLMLGVADASDAGGPSPGLTSSSAAAPYALAAPAACSGSCGAAASPGAAAGAVYIQAGGLEAAFFRLVYAGLQDLELRVVSFGAAERRLLLAAAAGSAARGRTRCAACNSTLGAAPPEAGCLEPCAGSQTGAGSVPRKGLTHVSVRLMPSPQHAAPSSASFAACSGLGNAFGGGSAGSTPSASLSCIPLALGNAAPAAAAWAQPSEADAMLATLPHLPALTTVQLPELLVASCHPLRRLGVLNSLTHLHVGGVVAAGVAPSAAAPLLPALRSLHVESESLASYSSGGVPWWSLCPALQRLTLVLHYDSAVGGGGAVSSGAAERLAAAMSRLQEVRLVVVAAATPSPGGSTAAAVGASAYGSDRGADGCLAAALRCDLPLLVRDTGGALRHVELIAAQPALLMAALPAELLASQVRLGNGGGSWHGGVETLKLALAHPVSHDCPAAVAAAAADPLLACCLDVVRCSAPPLVCLCLAVPGLWSLGELGSSCCRQAGRAGAEGALALAAEAVRRGTRLCLGALSTAQRVSVLHACDRAGLHVREGRCPGCVLGRPSHALQG